MNDSGQMEEPPTKVDKDPAEASATVDELINITFIKKSAVVARPEHVDQIKRTFEKNAKWVLVHGPEGAGKSTLAKLLAFDLVANFKVSPFATVWFDAASKSSIRHVYHTRLAGFFKLDQNGLTNELFVKHVNKAMGRLKVKYLLVFDGALSFRDVEPFVAGLDPHKFKVLVTTSSSKFDLGASDARFERIGLSAFGQQEAAEFMAKAFPIATASSSFASFVSTFSAQSRLTPLSLGLARHALELNPLISEHSDDVSIGNILELLKRTPESFDMATYLSYLNGSYVSFDLVGELLKLTLGSDDASLGDVKVISEHIKLLVHVGLVTVCKRNEKYGVIVHKTVQGLVVDWLDEAEKNRLVSKLVAKIDSLTPSVEQLRDESWTKMDALFPHVSRLTSLVSSKSAELASIHLKLAKYYGTRLSDSKATHVHATAAYKMFKSLIPEDKAETAECFSVVSQAYQSQGVLEKALRYAELSFQIFKSLDHPQQLQMLKTLGILHFLLGDVHKSMKYLKHFYQVNMASETRSNYDMADVLVYMGVGYERLGNYEKALTCFRNSLANFRKLSVRESQEDKIAKCLNNVGLVEFKLGRLQAALEAFLEAHEIYKRLYPFDTCPDAASTLNNIGFVYRSQNDWENSIKYLLLSYEKRKAVYIGDHVETARSLSNIAMAYEDMQDTDSALSYYKKSLEVYQGARNADQREVGRCLNKIGLCYGDLGEYELSLEYFIRAYEVKKEIGIENDLESASYLNNIGSAMNNLGNYKSALEYLLQSNEIYRSNMSASKSQLTNCLDNIGSAYQNSGDLTKALEFYKASLGVKEENGEASQEGLAESLIKIGLVYDDLGESAIATEYYKRSHEISEAVYSGKSRNGSTKMLTSSKKKDLAYYYLRDSRKFEEFKQLNTIVDIDEEGE